MLYDGSRNLSAGARRENLSLMPVSVYLIAMLLVLSVGCQSLPDVAHTSATSSISWPERLISDTLRFGEVSGNPILLYGIHGHGHVAGWYRPMGGPLSMLSVMKCARFLDQWINN